MMDGALVTLGTGAVVALLVGAVKTAFPEQMGSRASFLLAALFVAGFTALGAYTHRLEGDLYDWVFTGLEQFLTAIGARETVQFGARQATGRNFTLRGG